MPWCEDCSKFWNPNSLPPDGTCPTCGRLIAEPPEEASVPWHFWILVVLVVVYLGWRLVQLFQWLADNGNTGIAVALGALLAALVAALVVWLLRREPDVGE